MDAIAEYDKCVRTFVDRHPRMSDRNLAARIVDSLSPERYREILLANTIGEVMTERRSRARKIEEDARSAAAHTPHAGSVDPEPEPVIITESVLADFQRLYDDPALWTRPTPYPPHFGMDNTGRTGIHWYEAGLDQAFRDWCEATHGLAAIDGWLDRAILLIEDDEQDWEDFEIHWLSVYYERVQTKIRFQEEQCIHDEFHQRFANMLQVYADHVRFEVTAELLGSLFATGDGTQVTWRDATVAQHEERIDLLTKMIAGTSETAAMHVSAVRMIKDAGVENLGQVNSG